MWIQLNPTVFTQKHGFSNKMSSSNRKVVNMSNQKHLSYRKINNVLNSYYPLPAVFLLPQQTASETLKLLDCRNRWFSRTATWVLQWLKALVAVFPSWWPEFDLKVRSCGICGGQNDIVEDFRRVFRFLLTILILPTASRSLIFGHQALLTHHR
jgi:hypothetical protein